MTPFRLNIGIIYNISKNSFGKCSFDNVTKCHTQCKHRKKWTCPPPKKIRECPRINRVKRPLVAIVTQMEAKGEFGWCFHNAPRVKVRVNGVNKTVCFLFEDVAVRFQSPTDIYLSQVLNTVAMTTKFPLTSKMESAWPQPRSLKTKTDPSAVLTSEIWFTSSNGGLQRCYKALAKNAV